MAKSIEEAVKELNAAVEEAKKDPMEGMVPIPGYRKEDERPPEPAVRWRKPEETDEEWWGDQGLDPANLVPMRDKLPADIMADASARAGKASRAERRAAKREQKANNRAAKQAKKEERRLQREAEERRERENDPLQSLWEKFGGQGLLEDDFVFGRGWVSRAQQVKELASAYQAGSTALATGQSNDIKILQNMIDAAGGPEALPTLIATNPTVRRMMGNLGFDFSSMSAGGGVPGVTDLGPLGMPGVAPPEGSITQAIDQGMTAAVEQVLASAGIRVPGSYQQEVDNQVAQDIAEGRPPNPMAVAYAMGQPGAAPTIERMNAEEELENSIQDRLEDSYRRLMEADEAGNQQALPGLSNEIALLEQAYRGYKGMRDTGNTIGMQEFAAAWALPEGEQLPAIQRIIGQQSGERLSRGASEQLELDNNRFQKQLENGLELSRNAGEREMEAIRARAEIDRSFARYQTEVLGPLAIELAAGIDPNNPFQRAQFWETRRIMTDTMQDIAVRHKAATVGVMLSQIGYYDALVTSGGGRLSRGDTRLIEKERQDTRTSLNKNLGYLQAAMAQLSSDGILNNSIMGGPNEADIVNKPVEIKGLNHEVTVGHLRTIVDSDIDSYNQWVMLQNKGATVQDLKELLFVRVPMLPRDIAIDPQTGRPTISPESTLSGQNSTHDADRVMTVGAAERWFAALGDDQMVFRHSSKGVPVVAEPGPNHPAFNHLTQTQFVGNDRMVAQAELTKRRLGALEDTGRSILGGSLLGTATNIIRFIDSTQTTEQDILNSPAAVQNDNIIRLEEAAKRLKELEEE